MEEQRFCLSFQSFKLSKSSRCNTWRIIFYILTLTAAINLVKSSESNSTKLNRNYWVRNLKNIETIAGKSFGKVFENGTFRTGNVLWDNVLNKCTVDPTVSCLQSNVYSYLDDRLGFDGDVDVASGVCFKKNKVDINKYSKEANIIYVTGSKGDERSFDEDNEIENDEVYGESETPLEEVTDALYDKGVKFLVTHDLKLKLPELFFHGATLRISPRALTKTGALVHLDLEPKETQGEGRIFFKKIKKYLKKKLLMAALAIILVVKLIALKLIFVLPLILGVTTAKKMFLKLLLFLFPALSHIFKLCSWYHQNYHTTKYHHHHHLITHQHKPHHGHSSSYHPSHGHHPTVVVRPHAEGPPPAFEHHPQDWELSGPGLGSEYIASGVHRNAIANFKPNPNDMNDINAWGLGLPPGQSMDISQPYSSNAVHKAQQPSHQVRYQATPGNAGRPVGPPNPYYRNKKPTAKDPAHAEKDALIRAASLAAHAPPSAIRDEILRVSAAKLAETNKAKDILAHEQLAAAVDPVNPDAAAAENFYGTLLDKVDMILVNIGATDVGCKERAICSLYRDPFRHTPYSNLVSNELSKDSSELLPAADSKKALQYYVYVQAARDGQEGKDCAATYPNCGIDYNKKKKR